MNEMHRQIIEQAKLDENEEVKVAKKKLKN
jgi:hypothetical protein